MRIFFNYLTIISIVLSQTKYNLGIGTYLLISANLIYSLFFSRYATTFRYDFKYIGLIFIIVLSFIANEVPGVFNSHFKFIGFIIVLLFSSNLVSNPYLAYCRNLFLSQINKVFIVFTTVCLLGLLAGVFPRFNESETAGGFSGIFASSMMLAPICSLVIIYNFYLSVQTRKYLGLRILLTLSNFYLLFLTGSRSALLALLVALIFFMFKEYSNKLAQLFRRYWYLAVVVTVLLFNSSQISFFNVFITKFEIEEDMGMNSRQSLWDNRIAEFKSNPIFGIGFNSVNLDISSYEFDEESGSIEAGSSWFFLLSTLGLLGVVIYILIFSDFFKRLFKKNCLYQNYLLGIVIFFIIHMSFEGYIFAVGNILVYVFYLALANLTNISSKENDLNRRSLH